MKEDVIRHIKQKNLKPVEVKTSPTTAPDTKSTKAQQPVQQEMAKRIIPQKR